MAAVNDAWDLNHMNVLTREPTHIGSPTPVAIVGLAGRFPGEATNAKNLWDMCCQGRSAWSEVPKDRFNSEAYFHPNPSKSGCVRNIFLRTEYELISDDSSIPEEPISSKKMLPSSTHHFSVLHRARQRYELHSFCGHVISDTICKAMDPQQRLLLETTYEAFENGKSALHSEEQELSFVGSWHCARHNTWFSNRSLRWSFSSRLYRPSLQRRGRYSCLSVDRKFCEHAVQPNKLRFRPQRYQYHYGYCVLIQLNSSPHCLPESANRRTHASRSVWCAHHAKS